MLCCGIGKGVSPAECGSATRCVSPVGGSVSSVERGTGGVVCPRWEKGCVPGRERISNLLCVPGGGGKKKL